jgi:hypothetical protein
MTRLKSVAAAPAAEDISSSEEDRQNLIQVIEMSHVTLVFMSVLERLIKLTIPEWKPKKKMQGQSYPIHRNWIYPKIVPCFNLLFSLL